MTRSRLSGRYKDAVRLSSGNCIHLELRSKTMPGHTVLSGGRLIDGTGSAPIENPVILVQGAKIVAVGREGDIAAPQAEEDGYINRVWV